MSIKQPNYFDILQLKPCYNIDKNKIKSNYIKLCKVNQQNTQCLQQLNKALKTLQDDVQRANYCLKYKNLKSKTNTEDMIEQLNYGTQINELKENFKENDKQYQQQVQQQINLLNQKLNKLKQQFIQEFDLDDEKSCQCVANMNFYKQQLDQLKDIQIKSYK